MVAGDGQVSTDLGDEVLILSLASGDYHRLEGVGARIWEMLGRPVRVGDVRDAIAREYAVDAERCERDAVELLEELRRRGLIEVREEA